MKRFFTLALYCLCLVSLYAQTSSDTDTKITKVSGIYLFEKAELFIRNLETQAIVEHKIITDTATIDPYEFHLENIFLDVEFRDDVLIEATFPDREKYVVDEMLILQQAKDDKKESEPKLRAELDPELENKNMYEGRSLSHYILRLEGEKLVVAFNKYSFGNSGYSYTLEAELIVTMTKQKEDETDNI